MFRELSLYIFWLILSCIVGNMSNSRPPRKISREPTESEDLVFIDEQGSPTFPRREIANARSSPAAECETSVTQDHKAVEDEENLPKLMNKVDLDEKYRFPPADFTGGAEGTSVDDANAPISKNSDEGDPEDKITSSPTKTRTPVKLRRTSSSLTVKTLALPKVNCQEKIFLCIDHSVEMFHNKFQSHSSNRSSVFKTLTSVLKQFVRTKSLLNKKHQFSLIMLNDDSQLITDFNPNFEELLFMLDSIADSPTECISEQDGELSFDLSNLFHVIKQQAGLPRWNMKQAAKLPPPHIVRVIFVYGRSNTKLQFLSGEKTFTQLNSSPFFFLDCVYIHEATSTDTGVIEETFSDICALDTRGTSHIYEIGIDLNMACLYNTFAKLLAHPLQRSKQGEGTIRYNLDAE